MKAFSTNQAFVALAIAVVIAGWYFDAQFEKLFDAIDRVSDQATDSRQFIEQQFVVLNQKIPSEGNHLDDKIDGIKEQLSGTNAELLKMRELLTELRIGVAIVGSEKARR